jgi:hypothetical protein
MEASLWVAPTVAVYLGETTPIRGAPRLLIIAMTDLDNTPGIQCPQR